MPDILVRSSGRLSKSILNNYPLQIGASSKPDYLTGMVDEVSVFRSTLSGQEVASLFMAHNPEASQAQAAFRNVLLKKSSPDLLKVSVLVEKPETIRAIYARVSDASKQQIAARRQRSLKIKLIPQASSATEALYSAEANLGLVRRSSRARVAVIAVTDSGALITHWERLRWER